MEAAGTVTGFLITTGDKKTIYVSGDTVPFSGTEEIASRYASVDLAILYLGRVQLDPMGDTLFSLSAEDAIRYAQALRAGTVVLSTARSGSTSRRGGSRRSELFAASEIADRTPWLRSAETTVIE